jgi:hypothetical protein
VKYKAFISYSHAADGRLAPALHSALHRFNRPFYWIRAINVFRDKTGLAMTPALWPAITAALGHSEYFLLLASAQAAQSKWVKEEIAWWIEHRDIMALLIVLTDGTIVWDSEFLDFNWKLTSALPDLLRTKFPHEPLYVDLRWAKTEETLDLRHSRFRNAVLDIATPLHGIPKEDLDSDDVRQHRATKRFFLQPPCYCGMRPSDSGISLYPAGWLLRVLLISDQTLMLLFSRAWNHSIPLIEPCMLVGSFQNCFRKQRYRI